MRESLKAVSIYRNYSLRPREKSIRNIHKAGMDDKVAYKQNPSQNLPAWLGRDIVCFGKYNGTKSISADVKPEIKIDDVNFTYWKKHSGTAFVMPDSLGQELIFNFDKTYTLGTEDSSYINLCDYSGISKNHLSIINKNNSLHVIDNKSEKGTKIIRGSSKEPEIINLKPLVEYKLKAGDKLVLANNLTFNYVEPDKLYNANIELGLPFATKEAIDQSNIFSHNHRIQSPIVDGYRDAGRFVEAWDYNGLPSNELTREAIIVDRKRDPVLQQTIENFKKVLKRYPDLDENARLDLLNKYVVSLLSNIGNTEKFPKKGILLGEIIDKGAGICRHRALLFKVIGDEIGLKVSIRRGRFMKGPHLWNEVELSNEKIRICDPMHYEVVEKYISSSYTDLQGNRIY